MVIYKKLLQTAAILMANTLIVSISLWGLSTKPALADICGKLSDPFMIRVHSEGSDITFERCLKQKTGTEKDDQNPYAVTGDAFFHANDKNCSPLTKHPTYSVHELAAFVTAYQCIEFSEKGTKAAIAGATMGLIGVHELATHATRDIVMDKITEEEQEGVNAAVGSEVPVVGPGINLAMGAAEHGLHGLNQAAKVSAVLVAADKAGEWGVKKACIDQGNAYQKKFAESDFYEELLKKFKAKVHQDSTPGDGDYDEKQWLGAVVSAIESELSAPPQGRTSCKAAATINKYWGMSFDIVRIINLREYLALTLDTIAEKIEASGDGGHGHKSADESASADRSPATKPTNYDTGNESNMSMSPASGATPAYQESQAPPSIPSPPMTTDE